MTSAKEGDVQVAEARPFPFQDATRQSGAAGGSPRRSGIGDEGRATPPILARIPDVTIGPRRIDPPSPDNRAADSSVKYRVDASHISTAGDVTSRLKKSRQAAKQLSSESDLEQLSATIRFGVKAWELVQANPAALRAVGMFLLTVAAGTSMMLAMGRRAEQSEAPIATQPTPTAASSAPAWPTKPAASAPETEHGSTGATTLVPTAIGPGGMSGRSPENIVAPPLSAPSAAIEFKLPQSESVPRLQADEPWFAPGTARVTATASGYPTTSCPPIKMPGLDSEPLPQAQTTEPAVARFSGNIEHISR